jgi:hypothetical protein
MAPCLANSACAGWNGGIGMLTSEIGDGAVSWQVEPIEVDTYCVIESVKGTPDQYTIVPLKELANFFAERKRLATAALQSVRNELEAARKRPVV